MKISILLIEDDRDMRDLVATHLEHSGFDVQKAEDGIRDIGVTGVQTCALPI